MTPGALPLELLLFFPSASLIVPSTWSQTRTGYQRPTRSCHHDSKSLQQRLPVVTASWRTNKKLRTGEQLRTMKSV
ncbi:phospholamban isoform X1 [Excalfactoria chinensis]|uniref:phospholamban isoform X1 n=1 Tax=Excalfactoria chinensis TaxID=46218 RepID=UPI003B3B3F53